MPGVCEGAGRGAAGGNAAGVSRAAGGAVGDVARSRFAQRSGGCCERWKWRRVAADAGWSAADVGADVAVGWRCGTAALLALFHLGIAQDAAGRRGYESARGGGAERAEAARRRTDRREA